MEPTQKPSCLEEEPGEHRWPLDSGVLVPWHLSPLPEGMLALLQGSSASRGPATSPRCLIISVSDVRGSRAVLPSRREVQELQVTLDPQEEGQPERH